jgi:hypothetical protein
MKWWTSDELAGLYEKLIDAGVEFVVIGGQAVNLWSEHYRKSGGLPPATWTALEPFASRDLDLLGGRLDAAAAAEALHVEVVLFEPDPRTAPPNSGTLYVPVGEDELIVQFLHTPFGARREEVRATARLLEWRGRKLPVMHPLLCLEAKVESFFGLEQTGRQDLKHIRLAIACVHGLLLASLESALEKQILTGLERVASLAASDFGIRLKLDHAVEIQNAIPWPELESGASSLPKLAAFLEKRWPQLRTRISSREEAFVRRFRGK